MHVRAHAHTKTLNINIHFSFLNHFLGSGLMGQFSLRYTLFSSQQFFSNSSHTFFWNAFSLFPSKSLACPWQAAQWISFLILFQLKSFIPSLKHPLREFLHFFSLEPPAIFPLVSLQWPQSPAHKQKTNQDSYILYPQITQIIFQ